MVKHAGLATPYPNLMAQGNCTASCMVTGDLVAALQGFVELLSGNHSQFLTNRREEIWRKKGQEAKESLSSEVRLISPTESLRLY